MSIIEASKTALNPKPWTLDALSPIKAKRSAPRSHLRRIIDAEVCSISSEAGLSATRAAAEFSTVDDINPAVPIIRNIP